MPLQVPIGEEAASNGRDACHAWTPSLAAYGARRLQRVLWLLSESMMRLPL